MTQKSYDAAYALLYKVIPDLTDRLASRFAHFPKTGTIELFVQERLDVNPIPSLFTAILTYWVRYHIMEEHKCRPESVSVTLGTCEYFDGIAHEFTVDIRATYDEHVPTGIAVYNEIKETLGKRKREEDGEGESEPKKARVETQ
jgi:hypothetical protein